MKWCSTCPPGQRTPLPDCVTTLLACVPLRDSWWPCAMGAATRWSLCQMSECKKSRSHWFSTLRWPYLPYPAIIYWFLYCMNIWLLYDSLGTRLWHGWGEICQKHSKTQITLESTSSYNAFKTLWTIRQYFGNYWKTVCWNTWSSRYRCEDKHLLRPMTHTNVCQLQQSY